MYLDTQEKKECFGCEACAQACPRGAITLRFDKEGFRYPHISEERCVRCGLCRSVCPYGNLPARHTENKYVFGGYHQNPAIRFESTSGGAFSAVADAFCDENYVIFGAVAKGLAVHHGSTEKKSELWQFRGSKYAQSEIGDSYLRVKHLLSLGKKVLFSGTPCQIAGLKAFLGKADQTKLLTVEVICEGVPSPLYLQKYEEHLKKKYGSGIRSVNYRYTGGKSLLFSGMAGKWDFEMMRITLLNRKKPIVKDRWFNPFWSIWLDHLMSRPSCYECPFAEAGRVADISLGDLWGVHLYCPELYGKNGGASLIVANTKKGKAVLQNAQNSMHGHALQFEDAVKYQSPLRRPIGCNPERERFMRDLESEMPYPALNQKWAKRPTLGLLWQKYIWGNRQKVFVWEARQRLMNR